MQQVSRILKLKENKGVGLIEILVALLLVSIAGFSVLSMSSFATQDSNSLRFEMTADYLGRSLLSRAAANASISTQTLYTIDSSSAVNGTSTNCSNGCNATDIARLDIQEWSNEVSNLLPEAQFKTWWVENQLRVAVAWTGPVSIDPDPACPFTEKAYQGCKVYTSTIAL